MRTVVTCWMTAILLLCWAKGGLWVHIGDKMMTWRFCSYSNFGENHSLRLSTEKWGMAAPKKQMKGLRINGTPNNMINCRTLSLFSGIQTMHIFIGALAARNKNRVFSVDSSLSTKNMSPNYLKINRGYSKIGNTCYCYQKSRPRGRWQEKMPNEEVSFTSMHYLWPIWVSLRCNIDYLPLFEPMPVTQN